MSTRGCFMAHSSPASPRAAGSATWCRRLALDRQRPMADAPLGQRRAAVGRRPSERAEMRDEFRGSAQLLYGTTQLTDQLPLVHHAKLYELERLTDEQAGVVKPVFESGD